MNTTRLPRRFLKTAAVAFAVLFAFIAWSFVDPPTYEIEYRAPETSARLVAGFRPMHAYLAEYERSLAVVLPDGTRTEIELFPDTGGYRRSQLYQAEHGVLYFRGYFDVARVNPKTGEIKVISTAVPEDAKYLGAFDHVRDIGWRFLLPSESAEQKLEASGG